MVRTNEYDAVPETEPPPSFSEAIDGFTLSAGGLTTTARITEDGLVALNITEKSHHFSSRFQQVQQISERWEDEPPLYHEETKDSPSERPVPALNVLIQIIGSRGDIQPFVALGTILKAKWNHRVRIATHPTFKGLIEENSLEFFDIGGEPAKLMAYMVKHPGLLPGISSITGGQITEHRQMMTQMLEGFWRSCIANSEESRMKTAPFVADIIIANPPSYAHIHCAHKLGIPLHIMFTMPWSPNRSFPHPLANIGYSEVGRGVKNYLSYALVETMIWRGLGDVVNDFRTKTLHLHPVSFAAGSSLLAKSHVPHTYCWSPALVPKPADWGPRISVSGFCFHSAPSDYEPDPALEEFLVSGPAPIYVGFGSIVIDDPDKMTSVILGAIRKTGHRAIISHGWANLGGPVIETRDILLIGNVPHEWVFPRVSCVVHHGGAGTTAAGLAAGKPTVIIPFFGDQPFWGDMVFRSGAGPQPIPRINLTCNSLADAITEALRPSTINRAVHLGQLIASENGMLSSTSACCSLGIEHSNMRLSALSAAMLLREKLIQPSNLRLLRHKEYNLDQGLEDPLTAALVSTFGGVGNVIRGLARIGLEPMKAMRTDPFAPSSHNESVPHPKSHDWGSSASTVGVGSHWTRSDDLNSMEDRKVRAGGPTDSVSNKEAPIHDGEKENLFSPSLSSLIEQPRRLKSLSPAASEQVSIESKPDSHHTKSATGHLRLAGRAATGFGKGIVKGSSQAILHAATTPFDVIAATTRGLHNAPKLYGDDTVRPVDRIDGVGSGLKAAGKALGLGVWDGVTGVISQPVQGAKQEGPVGFAKGFIKGALGIGFKPAAGIMGGLSYSYEGLRQGVAEIGYGKTDEHIRASRLVQGIEELKNADADQQAQILSMWHHLQSESKNTKSTKGKGSV